MDKNDQQLLSEFADKGSESAFSAIIERHGPMVMGACRRILGNSPDTEDVFQATFLILARKASSIRAGTSLGGWLYRVAYRTACELKSKSVTNRQREREAAMMKQRSSPPLFDSDGIGRIIDKEISRLPERYRVAVVLCYLEDRSYEEAARELGWSLGSFKRRLSKGRDLLRSRLSRQGLAVPAVGLGLELGKSVVPVSVPDELVSSTSRTAVGLLTGHISELAVVSPVVGHLVKGGLRAMVLVKIYVASIVLFATTVAVASGLFFTSRVTTTTGMMVTGKTGDGLTILEYIPGKDPVRMSMTGAMLFANGLEIVADSRNNRFIYRKPGEAFKDSAIQACQHTKGITYNPRDGLYYGLDSNGYHVVAFRDLSKNEIAGKTSEIAGNKLNYPHAITVDPEEGWVYVITANDSILYRFKGIGKSEGALRLQRISHYCRSLTFVNGKVYVVGSSGGNIIEIDDFSKGKFTVHRSFGKKREYKVGNWETDGLIPNTADYYNGYWYVGSFFAEEFSKNGKDYNKNKLIRFRTWKDFETGNWEDLSDLLPSGVVPYSLTSRPEALYLSVFKPRFEPDKDKVYKIVTTVP